MRARPKKLRQFRLLSFLIRVCATLFVVLSTYNPSGVSYVHWLSRAWPQDWLLQVPVGVVYLLVYYILIRTTVRAIRITGIVLVTALLASAVWVMMDAGIIAIRDVDDLATILLYMLGVLFAIGISWMRVFILITGQVSVDRLDRL